MDKQNIRTAKAGDYIKPKGSMRGFSKDKLYQVQSHTNSRCKVIDDDGHTRIIYYDEIDQDIATNAEIAAQVLREEQKSGKPYITPSWKKAGFDELVEKQRKKLLWANSFPFEVTDEVTKEEAQEMLREWNESFPSIKMLRKWNEQINPNTKGDTTMYTYIAYRERKVQKTTDEGEKYWKTVREVLTPNPRVVDAFNETDAQIAAALQLQEEFPKVERDEIKVTVCPFRS